MGCGCSSKEAAIIKRRAKQRREMVFIQSIVPFFAVERLKVRGKMQPCALVWVGEESHLEKDFSVDEYVASQFEPDPRPQKGVDFMTEVNLKTTPQGSVFESQSTSVFQQWRTLSFCSAKMGSRGDKIRM
jgi:hypothetical protein